MKNTTNYFDDHFDDKEITPQRLCDFGNDTVSRLTLDGNTGFTSVIEEIEDTASDLQNDINGVDSKLNLQKGKTKTAGKVMEDFGNTMKKKQSNIEVALGGSDTEAYGLFYPDGTIGEYTKSTVENMTMLTNRVFDAATTYTTELGADLATLLKSYKGLWKTEYDEQQTQINTVGITRTTRSEKRSALEIALTKALGTITLTYPANADKCKSLVDFSKLYPAYHQEVFPYEIPHDGMVYHQHHFAADGEIELEVENDVTLRTFLCKSATTPEGQMQETVGIGNFKLKIADYHVDTKTNVYLLIFNLSTGETAIIKLHI